VFIFSPQTQNHFHFFFLFFFSFFVTFSYQWVDEWLDFGSMWPPKKKRGSDSVLKKHLADRPRLFCLARGNALILVGLLKFNLKAQAGQTSARETGRGRCPYLWAWLQRH